MNDPLLVEPILSTAEIVAIKQSRAIDETAMRTLLLEARTANGFLDVPVPGELVRRLIELSQLGPTSANTTPMRLALIQTPEAKARLRPLLAAGNVDKTMSAPLTAIVATDPAFYDHLPTLFPSRLEMRDMFANNQELAQQTATLNGTLGGAYFMLAARALGLDAGPMAGFDKAGVDREFLAETGWRSLWLVNLGYGDDTKLFPRNPRLTPEQVSIRV